MNSPDIVVVGGGPIGLWTAILTKINTDKQNTDKQILVVEKYHEYKRADIRLKISPDSFAGIPDNSQLNELVAKWKSKKVLPIKEMEEELVKLANTLGIQILKGKEIDPKKLQEEYPSAKVFVGADGARSIMRSEFFDDKFRFNISLQRLVQVQYITKIPFTGDESSIKKVIDAYKKLKFAGYLIEQSISPIQNDIEYSKVSLRIFIDQKTYTKMKGATFAAPYYFDTHLHELPKKIQRVLIKWWGMHNHLMPISDRDLDKDKKTNKITVIPLATYASKEFVKVRKTDENDPGTVIANVGDSAQAHPYFRAINNGLKTATKLAKCIADAFQSEDKKPTQSIEQFASNFKSYSRYATFRAYVEGVRAIIRNIFINISKTWIEISGGLPWETIKVSDPKKIYKKGINVWRELTDEQPPEYKSPKPLHALKNVSRRRLK
ncbi:MAG: hypothetical protein Q8K60_05875 [Parachlamydiaceae bacterium]|nr:hypothetical protein [Parachlamydiaceae bacterium]